MTCRNPEVTAYNQGLFEGRLEERNRIVAHIREAASRVLLTAMQHNQYDLEIAERAATVMEETANAIEAGDHWRPFV